jgi:hypothetical protein
MHDSHDWRGLPNMRTSLFGPSRSEWMPEFSFYDLKEEWERLVTYHARKRSSFRARELPRHMAACPAVWPG